MVRTTSTSSDMNEHDNTTSESPDNGQPSSSAWEKAQAVAKAARDKGAAFVKKAAPIVEKGASVAWEKAKSGAEKAREKATSEAESLRGKWNGMEANRRRRLLKIAVPVSVAAILCVVGAIAMSHSGQDVTSRSSTEESAGKKRKYASRKPTDIERDYGQALDALLGHDGQERDIVKAYRGFTEALDKGYAQAATAIAHVGWTLLYSDNRAEDGRALKSAGYSMHPINNVPFWYQGIRSGSHVAKFELGFYKIQAALANGNDYEEGLSLIEEAAEEGCPPASTFLKVFENNQLSSSISPKHILQLMTNHDESLPGFWKMCELELKREYLLSLQK